MLALHPYLARLRFTIGRLFLALLLILALILASPVGAARGKKEDTPNQPPDSFYSMTFGRSGLDLVVTQYWSKGPFLRSVTVVAGHPIVSIVTGKDYYTYDALTRKGYVIRRSKGSVARDDERQRPFALDLQELIDEGGEKIREETL
ncbi:MAG: hypothetical protein VCC04_13070, partial [Myxococcota bacterium]